MEFGTDSYPRMHREVLQEVEVLATDLKFPEGPVALADGSVLIVEMERGTLTRVDLDGHVDVVADCGARPNGAAIGPDGAVYICNNGGKWPAWSGGRIERVDVATGTVEVLYTQCEGAELTGPNDLVFDRSGGFWFTDLGQLRDRFRDYGRIFYASPTGTTITQVFDRLETPNGIGLSPDWTTLIFAESVTCRVYRRDIVGPGQVSHTTPNDPGTLLCGLPLGSHFDSLAIDAVGNICVGTIGEPGSITVISADGSDAHQFLFPDGLEDRMPTKICFGGHDLKTAYITQSVSGRLLSCRWPSPGLPLAFSI
jgi:gluconolactonase